MARSPSPPVLHVLEQARVAARRLGHDALLEEHVLLAFATSAGGAHFLSAQRLDVARLQTSLEHQAGHREAGGYRGAPLREDVVAPLLERAGAMRSLWRRLSPVRIDDLFGALAVSPALAPLVQDARFDVSPIVAFAERAKATATARRHRNVLAEHALLGSCNHAELRDPLERAGVDVGALRKTLGKLLRRRRFASAKLAAPASLVALACVNANRRHAQPSIQPLLAELLRHPLVRKSLASEGVDAYELLFALVHGERVQREHEREARLSGKSTVMVFDDAYTTMQVVEEVLVDVFGLERAHAHATMLEVHERGSAAVGSFDAEDAKARVASARRTARDANIPLRFALTPLR